jgi:UDP-N-acetylglucosamine:LPS N-acetylglucosamine transferase
VAGGGALKYNEKDVTGNELAGEIVQLLGDEEKLKNMGNSMRDLAFPDAAEKIVACCLELVRPVNGK